MVWAAESSVRRGYVAASISYRLREDIEGLEIVEAIRDARQDAQDAVRFFRANAETYGIDPDLIVIGGYSAGAVTALQVAVNEHMASPGPSARVTAAVSMAGAYGGTPTAGEPPIVMFHGTEDTTVPYALGVQQCELHTAAGNVCEFHSYPGEGHVMITPMPEILELTYDFLYRFVSCGLPFSDVPPTHVFCGDIDWMATNAISEGYPDGTYRPLDTLTRQAAVAFLWVLGGSLDCDWPAAFSDVSDDHPFATEIGWAADAGVVGGYADGTFRPGGLVTRQAFVSFLWKMAGSPTGAPNPGFSDIGTGHPFYQPIAWAADHDIVGGYPDGTFRAGATVTRQAAAAFVHRADDDLGAPSVGCPI
jgi:predicted esterase